MNKSTIILIEKVIGYSLPVSYIGYKANNGIQRLQPNIFYFKDKNGRSNGSDLNYLYSDDDNSYNIIKNIEIYKISTKRMPVHIVPIGEDSGGNQICISCGEKDYGYIYFWDHENEVDYSVSDDSDYSNLYLIAKSFDEFINGLMTEEEADKRFSDLA